MLYLSHKAVHAEFIPAERHRGRYQNKRFVSPKTMDPANVAGAPMWVQNQRNSWHGVEFPYHSTLDIGEYYKRYAETMLAVDEGLGRLLDLLKAKGWLDSTLIIFMGDNGFSFGEHGLIENAPLMKNPCECQWLRIALSFSSRQRRLPSGGKHRYCTDSP